MPPAVIAKVTVPGKAEPSILTYIDTRHGREIGDYPQEEPVADDEDSAVNYARSPFPSPQDWKWQIYKSLKMSLKVPMRTLTLDSYRIL
jgi:hypothetical protein